MASTPVVAHGVVYVSLMGPAPCTPHQEGARGGVIALDARTGRSLWMFHTGVVESSPLLVNGLLYFATYTERHASAVIAFDVRTHRPRWTYAVAAKIASSPSLLDGTIYVGADGGRVLALDARTGRLRWVAALSSRRSVYATPAIAYGRVFIGGLDGRMYALGAASGALLWRTHLGARIYSSTAVYRRTVFVASYENGTLWALDAATGAKRWSYGGSGRILGSPTVVDGLVYVSTTRRTTLALDARTGTPVWSYPDGQYTAVVSEPDRLYLVGLARVYGLATRDGVGRARPG
jgi:serine/threonine-protein kinase